MIKLLPIFVTVFLAELGDKTQLATVLFASEKGANPLLIFLAAAAALVLSTALAVFLGGLLGQHLERIPLKLLAGIGFMLIGAWSVWEHFHPA